MKNVFKTIAALAAISLAFASCRNKELAPETPMGPTHTVKFTTGVPETKTEMSIVENTVSFSWSDDDLDRLTIKENGEDGIIDTERSTINGNELVVYATFEGEPSEEQKTYTAVLNGSVGNQTPREDSYDKNADILIAEPVVAIAAEAIKFKFGRPVAINKMTLSDLPEGETLTSVKVSSDKTIAGTVGEEGWEDTATELVLTVGKEIPENGEVVLYYTSVPAEGAILTVDATVGTDSYKKTFGTGLTTTAGDVRGYGVRLKKQAHMVLTENFDSDKTTSETYGGAALTETIALGWDNEWSFDGSVYANKNSIRFGTGTASNTGYVSNSSMLSSVPAGTEFKVMVYAAQWDSDTELKVTYNSSDKSEAPANGVVSNANGTKYDASHFTNANTFTFTKAADKNELKIGNKTKRLMIDKVEVVYDGDAPTSINASDIDGIDVEGVSDETFNFTTVNVSGTPSVDCDGTVVTNASVEGHTVTYTVSENTTYKARQGTITITIGSDEKVVKVNQNGIVPSYTGAGTLDDPYTVADALLKIETLAEDDASEEVYVTGPIKSITTTSENFNYGQITYVLGTDDPDITLQIYSGKDFGGESFSSVGDIAVGQSVVVKGKLTLYESDDESTKEMKGNNQLVKVNGYDYVLKSIAVTGAKTLFNVGESFSEGDAVVTASYRGNKENTVVTASAEFTGYESTVGQHDITVSYTENGFTKTTQYQVTVASSTKYGISVNKTGTGSGTVSFTVNDESDITETTAGATVVVTVTPNAKNHIEAFSVTGLTGTQELGKDGKYEFTMPESAVTINVQFEPNPAATDGTTLWSYDFTTTFAYPGANINYSYSLSSSLQNGNLAGGTAPEYLISSNGGNMTITGVPTEGATSMTLTFLSNHADYLDVSVTGVTGGTSEDNAKATGKSQAEWKIVVPENTDNFNIVITNIKDSNARIDDLVLVVGAPKSAQTISFTESSKSITLGDDYAIDGTYDIQSASHTVGDGTVTYAVTSGTDVVTVNSSDGKVTIKKAGTATITATAAETETYKSASASYTLTISEAGQGGETTVELIFNTAEGLTELNIDQPSTGSGTNLEVNTAYTKSGVSIVNTKSGSTATRVWNSSGTLTLRIYKNATTKFTAPSGKNITKIEFTGKSASFGDDVSNKVWSGTPANSVELTCSANSEMNTVKVTYIN